MVGVAAIVLAVMWLPPVYQELAHSPGNVDKMLDYFSDAPSHLKGICNGTRVVAAQFTPTPDWVFGLRGVSPFSGEPAAMHQNPVPVLLLAFVVAAVLAFRRRYRTLRALVVVLGITLVIGTVAASQIIGAMAEYRLRWLWVVAPMTTAATLAIVLCAGSARIAPASTGARGRGHHRCRGPRRRGIAA